MRFFSHWSPASTPILNWDGPQFVVSFIVIDSVRFVVIVVVIDVVAEGVAFWGQDREK